MTKINRLTQIPTLDDSDLAVVWQDSSERTRAITIANLRHFIQSTDPNADAFVKAELVGDELILTAHDETETKIDINILPAHSVTELKDMPDQLVAGDYLRVNDEATGFILTPASEVDVDIFIESDGEFAGIATVLNFLNFDIDVANRIAKISPKYIGENGDILKLENGVLKASGVSSEVDGVLSYKESHSATAEYAYNAKFGDDRNYYPASLYQGSDGSFCEEFTGNKVFKSKDKDTGALGDEVLNLSPESATVKKDLSVEGATDLKGDATYEGSTDNDLNVMTKKATADLIANSTIAGDDNDIMKLAGGKLVPTGLKSNAANTLLASQELQCYILSTAYFGKFGEDKIFEPANIYQDYNGWTQFQFTGNMSFHPKNAVDGTIAGACFEFNSAGNAHFYRPIYTHATSNFGGEISYVGTTENGLNPITRNALNATLAGDLIPKTVSTSALNVAYDAKFGDDRVNYPIVLNQEEDGGTFFDYTQKMSFRHKRPDTGAVDSACVELNNAGDVYTYHDLYNYNTAHLNKMVIQGNSTYSGATNTDTSLMNRKAVVDLINSGGVAYANAKTLVLSSTGDEYLALDREVPVVVTEQIDSLTLIKLTDPESDGLPKVRKGTVGEVASGFSLCQDSTPADSEILQISSGTYSLDQMVFAVGASVDDPVYVGSDGKLTLEESDYIAGWVLNDGVIIDIDLYNRSADDANKDTFGTITTEVLKIHEGPDNPDKFTQTYVDGNFNTTVHAIGDTHYYRKDPSSGDLTEIYQIDNADRFIVKTKIKVPVITNPSNGTTNSATDGASYFDLSTSNTMKVGAKSEIKLSVDGSTIISCKPDQISANSKKLTNLADGSDDTDAATIGQLSALGGIPYLRKFDSQGGQIFAHSYPEGRVQSWINYKGNGSTDVSIDSMRPIPEGQTGQMYDMIALDNQSQNICKLRLFYENSGTTVLRIMPGEVVQCWTSREFKRWKWVFGTENSPTGNTSFAIEENNDEIITPNKGEQFQLIDPEKTASYGNANKNVTYFAPSVGTQSETLLSKLDYGKVFAIHEEINTTKLIMFIHESLVAEIYNRDLTEVTELTMLFTGDSRGRLGKSNQTAAAQFAINWNGELIPADDDPNEPNPTHWVAPDDSVTETWSNSVKSVCYSSGVLANRGSAMLKRGDVIYSKPDSVTHDDDAITEIPKHMSRTLSDSGETATIVYDDSSEFFVMPIVAGGGTFNVMKLFQLFMGRKSQYVEEWGSLKFDRSSDCIGTILKIAYDAAIAEEEKEEQAQNDAIMEGLVSGVIYAKTVTIG